ncbi:hypothetical protein AQUCO_05500091v1 [Aquilegia coerulea]|uniref:Uncharacterized protein n=1 Tax=Aquilegia coerulea TaxID=218851 RepID=A0A2G5CGX3_AQUCA|nr:hypothetical protein AQUCO_05500091v1 [Aquilegia coerulea]
MILQRTPKVVMWLKNQLKLKSRTKYMFKHIEVSTDRSYLSSFPVVSYEAVGKLEIQGTLSHYFSGVLVNLFFFFFSYQ